MTQAYSAITRYISSIINSMKFDNKIIDVIDDRLTYFTNHTIDDLHNMINDWEHSKPNDHDVCVLNCICNIIAPLDRYDRGNSDTYEFVNILDRICSELDRFNYFARHARNKRNTIVKYANDRHQFHAYVSIVELYVAFTNEVVYNLNRQLTLIYDLDHCMIDYFNECHDKASAINEILNKGNNHEE